MKNNIVILGAGASGQAIAHLIQDKEVRLDLWDKDPSKVENQKELNDIIPPADVLFLCVPSWSLREAIAEVQPLLTDKAIVVGLSKGLETNSNYRIDQLVGEQLPHSSFVFLSGPMLASLIEEDKRSHAIVSTNATQPEAIRTIEALFVDTRLSLETSHDVASAALAGVLKNIYAMVVGIVDALECGNNTKGWIVSQSAREMQKIAECLGLDPSVMLGTAGLADLVATGFSPSSNNHRVGRELALHGHTDLRSEGLVSLRPLVALMEDNTESLPLLHTLKEAIHDPSKTAAIFDRFLKSHK